VQTDAFGRRSAVTVRGASVFLNPADQRRYVFDKNALALSTNGSKVEYYGDDGTLLIGHVDEVMLPKTTNASDKALYLNPQGTLRTWTAAPLEEFEKQTDQE
jgi:surface antigen